MITLPVNIAFNDWASQVILDLDQYGVFAPPVSDNWQEFGQQFLSNLSLGVHSIPNPYNFTDWQSWADQFTGALS